MPGGGYWIAKNSWGDTWNGDGYGEISYAALQNDSYAAGRIDAINGQVYYTGAMATAQWSAASGTWSCGGLNWTSSGSPYAWQNQETAAVFTAGGTNSVTIDGVAIAHSLTFNAGATGYTFSGGSLTVTGGGITADESVTINSPLSVGAPQTWTAAAGKTLTVGDVHTIISPLTVNGAGSVYITGNIDGGGVINSLGAPPGSLTKTGAGTLVLAGSNSYGGTTIAAGVLTATTTAALPAYTTPGNVVVNYGGTLAVAAGGPGQWTSDQIAGILAGPGPTFIAGSTFGIDTSGGDFSYAPAIAGRINFMKLGANTLTLSGSSGYTGWTIINGGTLQVGNGGSGESLGGTAVVQDNASLVFNHADTVFFRCPITGSGSLTKAGPGVLVLTAANTFTGPTTITGGALQVGNGGSGASLGGTSAVTNSGNLVFNTPDTLTFSPVISGSGSLTQAGPGLLTLTAANTYSGATAVTGGTLQVCNNASLGGTSAVTMLNFGTLAFHSADSVSFAPAISGFGNLAQLGPGLLTLTNSSTYEGETTVSGGTLRIGPTGGLGNTAISVAGGATFAVAPGGGSIVAGGAGVWLPGATLSLGPGAVFDMTDGGIGTFYLNQQPGFAGTALSVNGATLKFDLSGRGADRLAVNQGAAAVAGLNTVCITGLGSGLTPGGEYPLISAPAGLIGGFVFPNGDINEALTVGGTPYKLTLIASGTAEAVHVYGPAAYQLAATAAGATIITGGSIAVTGVIQNTGSPSESVGLDYSGLSLGLSGVGRLAGPSPSGSGVCLAGSAAVTCTFTSDTPGTATFTPSAGPVTNDMIGGAASGGTVATATLTVLGHAAPSLSVSAGSNQTVIVGASGITAGLSLSNGTLNQPGLASLDVNSLGDGVSGPTGGRLVASGSVQSYAAQLDTGTLGAHEQAFSLNAGDDHTLPGSSAATDVFSGNVTWTVLDHSNASLSSTAAQATQTIDFGNVLKGASVPSRSFTIYNRAANTTADATVNLKLTGFTAGGDPALSTNLSAFSGLAAGCGTTCTVSLDTSNYTTTGSGTVSMAASQLVNGSSLPGAGSNNNGAVSVILLGNVGNATAAASNSQTVFGPALTAAVAANGSYANLESTVRSSTGYSLAGGGGQGAAGSTATVLAGTASGPATVSMAWRTPVSQPGAGAGEGFISDVLDLSGMAVVDGQTKDGSVHTDTFVLQMSYDPLGFEARTGLTELAAAEAGDIVMDYLDEGPDGLAGTADDYWELAVAGNFGNDNSHFVGVGPWNGDMTLGDYGVDVQSRTVWAVLDHNSQFAVVPEPSTLVCLLAAAVGWVAFRGAKRTAGRSFLPERSVLITPARKKITEPVGRIANPSYNTPAALEDLSCRSNILFPPKTRQCRLLGGPKQRQGAAHKCPVLLFDGQPR